MTPRPIAGGTFVVETSGEPESPPAWAIREFLITRGARSVTTLIHPLKAEGAPAHLIETWDGAAGRGRRRRVRLPWRPPLTYPLDLIVPPALPRADAHIGFNNLAAARGLAGRAAGRVDKVAYWAVDFVPTGRFGEGRPLTRVFDAVDRWVCRSVDMRFEVSEAALGGRDERHGFRPGDAPAQVAPMGAWLHQVPHVREDNHRARRVVWIGHMVERQGLGALIEALGLLARRGVEFELDLTGRGPEEPALRAAVDRLGLSEHVRFHGHLEAHHEVDAVLASASVAVAPYDPGVESFTRFADPAKLKSYLAAGLPIVTTDVPPNAAEVAERGGGEIVPYEPEAMAAAIERALDDPAQWSKRRSAALKLAGDYDWGRIVERALGALGFHSSDGGTGPPCPPR